MENQILDTTTAVKNINGFMKKSTLNIIFVGRELSKLKDKIDSLSGSERKSAELEYALMIENDLPFGEKVADKFVRIARNKYICRYAHNLPPSYSVLYELCTAKYQTDEIWKILATKVHPTMTTTDATVFKNNALYDLCKKKSDDTSTLDTFVDASPDLQVNADDFEDKKELGDTSDIVVDENSEQSPEIGDTEIVPEVTFESSNSDNVINFTPTTNDEKDDDWCHGCGATEELDCECEDDVLEEQFDDAVNIEDLVKISISPNATDEEVEFLMGLINEFEDKVNDFLADKIVKGEENAA
ncbi:hypothetical protein N9X12_06210 [Alphaproteobacteria bacterium]|nr:hypothetical protein [Alphaproteobacteria bacterium]